MSIAVRRNVAVYQPSKPFPRQIVPLATPLQHAPPCPTDFAAKAAQPIFVSGYTKVVEVTLHHLAQPFSDLGNRMVHLTSQLLPNRLQRRSHSLLHRQTQDFEPALAGLATAVRKSQKVECLRLADAPLFPVLCRESPEFDQPRFIGMQRQAKQCQTFPHSSQERFCILASFEPEHGVSQPREPPPRLLSEPSVNLSAHWAPIIQPLVSHPSSNAGTYQDTF